jgi:hypothetical protein
MKALIFRKTGEPKSTLELTEITTFWHGLRRYKYIRHHVAHRKLLLPDTLVEGRRPN